MSISDNDKWILSFYRHSEITGALFFGRLAQYISNPEVKHDLTKHFSDESMHAWYWEKCLSDLGVKSQRQRTAYQDKYFEHIGIPTNMMEILAITHVFEARVIKQYRTHMELSDVHPMIQQTFTTIMEDEKWHLQWVKAALDNLVPEYGRDTIDGKLKTYREIDQKIFGDFCLEHIDRLGMYLPKELKSTKEHE